MIFWSVYKLGEEKSQPITGEEGVTSCGYGLWGCHGGDGAARPLHERGGGGDGDCDGGGYDAVVADVAPDVSSSAPEHSVVHLEEGK